MAAVWTDDPTIGSALAGVASAAYGGPMLQLRATEAMQGIQQRRLEMQRLQQQMGLAKSLGDQASGLFGGGDTGMIGSSGPMIGQPGVPGSQASTGIGNIGGDQDQSSLSPSSGTPQQGGASGQPGAPTQRGQGNATLAPYYRTLMQLQAINGNTAGLQETMKEASLLLGENFGATNPREAMALHQIYNDLKGPAANNFASQLQNHVEGGNQLTIPQAVFMGRWAGANSPLQPHLLENGQVVYERTPPVSMKVLGEMARNGINLQGLPAPQPGAAPPQGAPQGAQGGDELPPGFGVIGGGPMRASREFADNQKMQQDPNYQNALETSNAARNLITALQSKSVAGDRAALTLYARTFLANARASGASEEQIKDYTSTYQQWMDGWEKMFAHGTTLPDEGNGGRQDLASRAAAFANNSKAVYDAKYGEGSPARSAYAASGLDPNRGIPTIDALRPYDPKTFQWSVPQIGQPATQGAPSRAPAADIQKLLGQ